MAKASLDIIINGKDNTGGMFSKLQSALGGIAQVAGGILAAGAIQEIGRQVVGLAKDSITAASNLEETGNKILTIFGESWRDAIEDWSADAATVIGQSQQSAMDAAATFGVFGKAAGMTKDELGEFALQMTELSSDLASFYNTSPEEAIQALGAALRGESEPIRRYGVLLDEATLKQKALAMGIITDTKAALTPAQKVLASYNVILDQTKDAQGDFAKTSDGLANQQRVLKAQFDNLKVSIGKGFLPIVQLGANILSKTFMPAAEKLINNFLIPVGPKVQAFADKLNTLFGYLQDGGKIRSIENLAGFLFGEEGRNVAGGLGAAMQDVLNFFQPLITSVQNLAQAFANSWPMIQGALQAIWAFLVQTFSTVGPVIVQNVADAVQIMSDLWNQHGAEVIATVTLLAQTLIATLGGALALITGAVKATLALIQGDEQAFDEAILTSVAAFMNSILGLVGMTLPEFVNVWATNLEMLNTIITTWLSNAIAIIQNTAAEWVNAGIALVQGLQDGIASKLNAVLDYVKSMAKKITAAMTGVLKIKSPSKVFEGIGQNLMTGLAQGIQRGSGTPIGATAAVAHNMSRVTNNYLSVYTSQSPYLVTSNFNAMRALSYD